MHSRAGVLLRALGARRKGRLGGGGHDVYFLSCASCWAFGWLGAGGSRRVPNSARQRSTQLKARPAALGASRFVRLMALLLPSLAMGLWGQTALPGGFRKGEVLFYKGPLWGYSLHDFPRSSDGRARLPNGFYQYMINHALMKSSVPGMIMTNYLPPLLHGQAGVLQGSASKGRYDEVAVEFPGLFNMVLDIAPEHLVREKPAPPDVKWLIFWIFGGVGVLFVALFCLVYFSDLYLDDDEEQASGAADPHDRRPEHNMELDIAFGLSTGATSKEPGVLSVTSDADALPLKGGASQKTSPSSVATTFSMPHEGKKAV